ncbi:2-phospho-L-lactate guanylyltransferase [bacterium BMS3Bbin09]|nr:2-phospho-L-lactate guanylyltransferase [bacterium BMS3Bbin09]
MNDNALIIIAKYPEKKNVKTRLKDSMSDEQRLELYVLLLNRAMADLGNIPGVDTFIAYAPKEKEDYFLRFNLGMIPLNDGDLGIGMLKAFEEVFSLGYKRASLVGADIPDLSPIIIIEAFSVLSENDLVYGPAKDGGYYLVGMRKLIKEVFESVPWSSDQTLKKSLEQATISGSSVGFTEMLSDIDRIEDVKNAGLI